MKISKKLIVIGVLVLTLILLYSFFSGSYNSMVTYEEKVSAQWSMVENVYQRRSDLIPNLVNTVKGAANFEKSTLEAVMKARAEATSVKISPENLNDESLAKFQQAQDGLSSALSRLLVSVENYPDLKANQNFLGLQEQLEGSENRIATERRKYNEMVQDYNVFIRKFPRNLIAGLFGFDKKGYFKAMAGSEKAPAVQF
jgi:LemA protein